MVDHPMRYIPSIKALQDDERFRFVCASGNWSEAYLTLLLQETVSRLREKILASPEQFQKMDRKALSDLIFKQFESSYDEQNIEGLTPVINATGIILHTNLGRARLSQTAVEQLTLASSRYTNLEFNIEAGERGLRHDHVERLLCQLTGAESAMVVNNNAAAVFLILRAFAKHQEVIVSRGELVEIGGSFRISSIMEESDAKLVEVGTTNKTHLQDYIDAISKETAMILKVHQSNFKILGFTDAVSRERLKKIAAIHELILYEDLGSGAFFDFKRYGIGEEPLVSEVIQTGVDLVSCSGDKLLGGPQAGIILGKKVYVDQLKKHQLARALRVDKMTLAALAATVKDYLNPEQLVKQLPVIRDMLTDPDTLRNRAGIVLEAVQTHKHLKGSLVDTETPVGGGTMPGVVLPSVAIALQHEQETAETLAYRLRMMKPSLVARIKEEEVLLDFRTISVEEIGQVIHAIQAL